jgi:hypothetical protein
LRREARKFLGYFVWKITILRQKIIFFSNFRGEARAGCAPPPLDPPLLSTGIVHINIYNCLVYSNKVKYTNMLIYYIVLSKSM